MRRLCFNVIVMSTTLVLSSDVVADYTRAIEYIQSYDTSIDCRCKKWRTTLPGYGDANSSTLGTELR